jgi:hypothetical protein
VRKRVLADGAFVPEKTLELSEHLFPEWIVGNPEGRMRHLEKSCSTGTPIKNGDQFGPGFQVLASLESRGWG